MILARFLVGLVLAGTAWLVHRFGPVRRFEIAEASMAPSLVHGDFVLTARVPPRRGTRVVYEHPERPSFFLAKRVIGLPGEEVTVGDGFVLIDGLRLPDPWARGRPGSTGTWRVPPGSVFVLGDRRDRSTGDSRHVGPVEIRALDAIVWRYRPLRRGKGRQQRSPRSAILARASKGSPP